MIRRGWWALAATLTLPSVSASARPPADARTEAAIDRMLEAMPVADKVAQLMMPDLASITPAANSPK